MFCAYTISYFGKFKNEEVIEQIRKGDVKCALGYFDVDSTVVIFDKEADEFVLNTAAVKIFVPHDAEFCIFFATYEEKQEKLCFLVRLRSPEGTVMPGVEFGTFGEGIGFVTFSNFRIKRQQLLNRFLDNNFDVQKSRIPKVS
jgi:hypothetical protein